MNQNNCNNCEISNCERNLEKLERNLEHNIDKAINNMENNINNAVNSMEENIQGAVNRMEENIDNALNKNDHHGENDVDIPPKVAGTYRISFEHVGEFIGQVYNFENPLIAEFEMVIKQNNFFTNLDWFFNKQKMTSYPNPGVLRKVGGRWELHSVSTIDQGTINSDLVINDENVCYSFSFIRTEPGIVPADPTKTSDYPSVSRGFSYRTISFSDSEKLTKLLNQLPPLPEGQLYAAMGTDETLSGDLLSLTSQEREARVVKEPSNIVDPINRIIGDPDLYMNRKYNGKGEQKLGIHRLVILTREDEIKLREAGYGLELVRYGDKVFTAFWYSWCPWCG